MADSHVLFHCGFVTQMEEQLTNNLCVFNRQDFQCCIYHILDTPGDGSNLKSYPRHIFSVYGFFLHSSTALNDI